MSEERSQAQGAGGAGRVLNEDGTTNWTVVFDDPEQGILHAVNAVSSEAQLRAVMDQVAQLLFKRKRDEGPRAEFKARIDTIIDGADDAGFETARDAVLALLEKEKNLRIQKALLHVKNKRASQSIERRRDEKAEGPFGFISENPLFVGGGIAAVLAAITVVLLLVVLPGSLGPGGGDGAGPAETKREEPQQKAATEKTPKTEAVKPSAPAAPQAKKIEVVAFKPVLAEVLVGGQKRRASYVPLVKMEEGADLSLLCTLSPRIIEGVVIMMQSATAAGRPIGPGVARKIGEDIAADINSRSRLVKIEEIMLRDLRDLPRDVIAASNRGCERVEIDSGS